MNATGTEFPLFHHFLDDSFFSFSARGNKNLAPQYKGEKVGKFGEQKWLNRLQMVQLNAPGTEFPLFHHFLDDSFVPFSAWGNKNWPPSIKVKKLENFGNKIGLREWKGSSLNASGTETQ